MTVMDDGGSVDLQELISAFLSDPSRTTLELPSSLNADQRKEARRLADQHPELKCESYGFGEERRLHLFKRNQDRLRVKNTFIDGWEGEQTGCEPPAFRSMPPNMPDNLLERTLQRCLVTNDLKSGDKLAGIPDASPTSSGAAPVELPPLPDGFQVRNTFIHIESVPVVERIVQSMPHGMFRQCLEAELEESATAPRGPLTAPPAAPPAPVIKAGEEQVLMPGTEVVIQGLVKLPDFNGLSGVVQSLDPETGRYDVLLDGPAGQCGWRWVKVKGENCRLCMPPPPANAPTLSMDDADSDPSKATKTLKLNGLV